MIGPRGASRWVRVACVAWGCVVGKVLSEVGLKVELGRERRSSDVHSRTGCERDLRLPR